LRKVAPFLVLEDHRPPARLLDALDLKDRLVAAGAQLALPL